LNEPRSISIEIRCCRCSATSFDRHTSQRPPTVGISLKGDTTLKNEIDSGRDTIQGNTESLKELVLMLDKFEFWFNIVTP